jgi:hypothetical protein
LEGLVVLKKRAGIERPLPGDDLQSLRPRFARAKLQHRPELLASFLVSVNRAFVKGTLVTCRLAQAPVELELENAGEEIAGVRDVRRNVVLRAGIEVVLGALSPLGTALSSPSFLR